MSASSGVTARNARLYGPPPGPAYDALGFRRFALRATAEPRALGPIEEALAREIRRDPDVWILDIDDPSGDGLLDIVTEP